MLKRYSQALAAVALAWFGGSAYAQQPAQTMMAANCGTCAPACEEKCGSFYSSIGVMYLKACANGNNAFSSFDCQYENATANSHFTTVNDFENGYDIGLRTTLGYSTNNGWGVRLRRFYWESADSINIVDDRANTPTDPGAPGTGVISVKFATSPLGIQFQSVGNFTDPSVLVFQNRIRVQAWDLEATRNARCGCLDLTASFGVRYLQINQDYNADERLINLPPTADFPPGATIDQHLRSQHTLNGLGPILGLEGRHTLWDSLRVYGLGKVGFIFCEGHQEAHYLGNFNPQFAIDPVTRSADATRTRMVTNAEVEVGLEYGYQLSSGSEFYVRGGLVGMVFSGAGNSSRSAIGAPPFEAKDENLTLFGLNLSVGMRY